MQFVFSNALKWGAMLTYKTSLLLEAGCYCLFVVNVDKHAQRGTQIYSWVILCLEDLRSDTMIRPTRGALIIINLGLNARRSPVSHLFLTRWVSQLLGLALVSCAFARIGVHRPSILDVFHSLLSAIGFQSRFFFTADVSPSIRSTLHFLTF